MIYGLDSEPRGVNPDQTLDPVWRTCVVQLAVKGSLKMIQVRYMEEGSELEK